MRPPPPPVVALAIGPATRLAAGPVAAAVVSARVAGLAEEVLRIMFVSRLKVLTVVLLAGLAVAGTTAYVLSCSGPPAPPPDAGERAVPPAGPTGPPPAAAPSRAEQLRAIEAEYRSAYEDVLKTIRAGEAHPDRDGGYAELAEVRKRFAERARRLVNGDPKDEVALDAILFGLTQLVADADDPKLYEVLAAHHVSSPKLADVVGRPQADERFLRAVVARSPHAEVRGRALLALATRLVRDDRPGEAEPLLTQILQDKELSRVSHPHGNLARGAENLLFEVRHLGVGKEAPEIDSVDMDDRPMKLSEYRGKVVLLVFWATWCGPCMAMVPHERELAQRYAGRPFAVVGVNGDGDMLIGPDKKLIDQKARVRETMKQKGITWRSFRDYLLREKVPLSRRWNVDGWPTVYVLDHRGVIRHKYVGVPETDVLDAAVARLVAAADAGKPDRK